MSALKPSAARMFFQSTIGLKIVMAASGFILAGFVLFHMLGNLQVFLGREAYNAYAEFMYGLGELLYIARFTLLALLALHVWSAYKLMRRNAAARPVRYASLKSHAQAPHARLMIMSGLVVLAYVAYHLAHFTLLFVHTGYMDPLDPRDVYTFFVRSFQNPLIVMLYVVANLLLASHLSHGLSSIFRTLGLSVGNYRDLFDKVGPAVGIIVAVGNLSMPLACLLGILSV